MAKKIGLIDVDSHNFPNLALMKLSAYHKSIGDEVSWWNGFLTYDRIYKAKVFDDTYSEDELTCLQAEEIICGGTGYGLDNVLPEVVEHQYPDYNLYQIKDTAYGFLTRGCPRACGFCIVSEKEGRMSRKVADLPEFWQGQPCIKLLDPNLLAAPEAEDLLGDLVRSKASIDFTQGLDIRLMDNNRTKLINRMRIKTLHFAWDDPKEDLTDDFIRFANAFRLKDPKRKGVYVLTNYGSTLDDDLYRIYTLRDLGYDPYVMVFNKPSAPKEILRLQRWCNNRFIFKSEPDFRKYRG